MRRPQRPPLPWRQPPRKTAAPGPVAAPAVDPTSGASQLAVSAKYLSVVAPTGGLDVTQALKNGYFRLNYEFALLTSVQQADLGTRLINAGYALGAWDIDTLKRNPTAQIGGQTMSPPGRG